MLLDTSAYKVSNWWRRRDSNPRPVTASRRHLHACPAIPVYRLSAWPTDGRHRDYSNLESRVQDVR